MTREDPIVLLHGVGLDASMWQPMTALLGGSVLALDLPGHGSRRPLDVPAALGSFAEDVLARMPDGPVHLVGFSLGALVAQHIARFHPERLRSLVCVSAVAQRTPEERAAVLQRLQSAHDDVPSTFKRSLERWFPEGTGAGADEIDRIRRILARNDPASFVAAYEVFARGDAELAEELARITVPTLAVTGSRDPGSTPEMTLRIAAAVPGARSHLVEGARHMLPIDAPHELAVAITAFIDRLEGTPRV